MIYASLWETGFPRMLPRMLPSAVTSTIDDDPVESPSLYAFVYI
jgi:hypothetical protein